MLTLLPFTYTHEQTLCIRLHQKNVSLSILFKQIPIVSSNHQNLSEKRNFGKFPFLATPYYAWPNNETVWFLHGIHPRIGLFFNIFSANDKLSGQHSAIVCRMPKLLTQIENVHASHVVFIFLNFAWRLDDDTELSDFIFFFFYIPSIKMNFFLVKNTLWEETFIFGADKAAKTCFSNFKKLQQIRVIYMVWKMLGKRSFLKLKLKLNNLVIGAFHVSIFLL